MLGRLHRHRTDSVTRSSSEQRRRTAARRQQGRRHQHRRRSSRHQSDSGTPASSWNPFLGSDRYDRNNRSGRKPSSSLSSITVTVSSSPSTETQIRRRYASYNPFAGGQPPHSVRARAGYGGDLSVHLGDGFSDGTMGSSEASSSPSGSSPSASSTSSSTFVPATGKQRWYPTAKQQRAVERQTYQRNATKLHLVHKTINGGRHRRRGPRPTRENLMVSRDDQNVQLVCGEARAFARTIARLRQDQLLCALERAIADHATNPLRRSSLDALLQALRDCEAKKRPDGSRMPAKERRAVYRTVRTMLVVMEQFNQCRRFFKRFRKLRAQPAPGVAFSSESAATTQSNESNSNGRRPKRKHRKPILLGDIPRKRNQFCCRHQSTLLKILLEEALPELEGRPADFTSAAARPQVVRRNRGARQMGSTVVLERGHWINPSGGRAGHCWTRMTTRDGGHWIVDPSMRRLWNLDLEPERLQSHYHFRHNRRTKKLPEPPPNQERS